MFLSGLAVALSCTSVTGGVMSACALEETVCESESESSFETGACEVEETTAHLSQANNGGLVAGDITINNIDTGETETESETKETIPETEKTTESTQESESETVKETVKETEPVREPETKPETKPETQPESESKKETESETVKETESKAETESESESETETETDGYAYEDKFAVLEYAEFDDVAVSGLPGFITNDIIEAVLKSQEKTGYPASVTVAQIILESGFGDYGNGLSKISFKYNNLFNIRGKAPEACVAVVKSSVNDKIPVTTDVYKSYNSITESIEDRDNLVKQLFEGSKKPIDSMDSKAFAIGLGYRWKTPANVNNNFLKFLNSLEADSESKDKIIDEELLHMSYGFKLLEIMDEYDLYRLDDMTVADFEAKVGSFSNPCPGAVLSSNFGFRGFVMTGAPLFHSGVDLATDGNVPTYAAKDGVVVIANYSNSAGNWVVIDHGDGLVTKYMHHSVLYVKPGQTVVKGQMIGLSGTTGMSTGNHLHFQVEKNGVAVNPWQYLNRNWY